MPTFLVEVYCPRVEPAVLRRVVERTRAIASDTDVRYVRTILVPEDETCFHLFDGPSAEAVCQVARSAELFADDASGSVKPTIDLERSIR